MEGIFDQVFHGLTTVLSLPIMFVIIVIAFMIMSGQKPEHAINWGVRCLCRIVSAIVKAVLGLLRSIANALLSACRARRSGRHRGGN